MFLQTAFGLANSGAHEKSMELKNHLSDLIEIFNKNLWHWAFYSYREDVWDNMDYELGVGNVPWKYWEYSKELKLHNHYNQIYGSLKHNPIWPVFQKEFLKN
jgi:hypothetical protein